MLLFSNGGAERVMVDATEDGGRGNKEKKLRRSFYKENGEKKKILPCCLFFAHRFGLEQNGAYADTWIVEKALRVALSLATRRRI